MMRCERSCLRRGADRLIFEGSIPAPQRMARLGLAEGRPRLEGARHPGHSRRLPATFDNQLPSGSAARRASPPDLAG